MVGSRLLAESLSVGTRDATDPIEWIAEYIEDDLTFLCEEQFTMVIDTASIVIMFAAGGSVQIPCPR